MFPMPGFGRTRGSAFNVKTPVSSEGEERIGVSTLRPVLPSLLRRCSPKTLPCGKALLASSGIGRGSPRIHVPFGRFVLVLSRRPSQNYGRR